MGDRLWVDKPFQYVTNQPLRSTQINTFYGS